MAAQLILGTVQFGLDYGISNRRGKIPSSEIAQIFYFANTKGINFLDTAGGYGDSELRIAEHISSAENNFQIVSKFSGSLPLAESLQASLQTLKVEKMYGYLIHHFSDLKIKPHLWDELNVEKEKGKIQKIGLSLYHPFEMNWAIQRGIIPDLVQIPFSIFDRRFQGLFSWFLENKVEVHVRSVFLQGLIFLNPDALPSFFQPLRHILIKLRRLAEEKKCTLSSLCLNFPRLFNEIQGVVMGVEGIENFKENVEDWVNFDIRNFGIHSFDDFKIGEEKYIIPSLWPK